MRCLNCGKEAAETDARCGSCGGSLFVNRRALRESQSTAGGAAPVKQFDRVPNTSGKVTPGLVLGLLALVVALIVVIPNLQRSRINGDGPSAVASLRTINTGAMVYASTYNHGFPPTLAALGRQKSEHPNAYGEPSEKAAGLIDDILAAGTKCFISCYRFSYIAGPIDSSGKISTYVVHADPVAPLAQEKTHYFMDQTGVIRIDKDREAYASSPPIIE